MLDVLTSPDLESLANVRHGFFTSHWGDCGLSTDGDQAQKYENRERVADYLNVRPDRLISCYQVHSPDVMTVTEPWRIPDRPQADAMVTAEAGIALGILTADCVPILLADAKVGVIGAAHAGWKGALSGVIENTVAAMEKLGAHAGDIVAAIGPCIWQNSYEVGPEFPAPFLAEDPANEKFFRPAFRSGHTMFNLAGYVERKLRKLKLAGITPSPADTCADEARFYSYRRSTLRHEKNAGRLISVIVRAG
jgi:YfiH family protein